MKLNKHGWGLREMLILSGILILFLIIAIYFIYTMYNNFEGEINAGYYQGLEEKLENQAKVFISDYYVEPLSTDKVTITRSVLNSYNLDVNLVDKDNNACSGYVTAYKSQGNEIYKSYIKCPRYMTEGYEGWKNE